MTATPLGLFPEKKIDAKGQVTPFDQNKEKKHISRLFTGVENNPLHSKLLPPSPVLTKEARPLTSRHVGAS